MNTLKTIFEHKREEVGLARSSVPLQEIKASMRDVEPPRGFRAALENSGKPLALIAEVKKASPSKGIIRPDFDAEQVAKAYERAGAQCLSVLTDEKFFQGSANNLRIAKRSTSLPCLRKDFIEDPYQVYESRAWGADAILLIVAWLTQSALVDLLALTQDLGMDALVEVHSGKEADSALESGARLIGVNNRNLTDFTTSLETSERLIPPLLGSDRLLVSESALETPADLERVRAAGAKAVLIGTTFCAAPDIEAKVREVMGW